MNIFGVGALELLLILVIMLIVAGPRRMVQWAYILGQYMGKLRVLWSQMMESMQQEFDEAGIDIKVPKDIPTRRDINRLASEALKPLEEPMQEAINEYHAETREMRDTIRSVEKDTVNTVKPTEWLTGTSPGAPQKPAGPTNSAPENTESTGASFGTWSSTKQSEDQE